MPDDSFLFPSEREPAPPPPLPLVGRSRQLLWIEIGVALAVGVIPDLVGAISWLCFPSRLEPHFTFDAIVLTTRGLSISIVILFMMWRSEEGWTAFGVVRPRWVRDAFHGVLLFATGYALHATWMMFAPEFLAGWWEPDQAPFASPSGLADHGLLVAMSVANGTSEELVLWAFLFTRLAKLWGKPMLAIIAVAGLFGSYHIYQGLLATSSIVILGLLHGVMFHLWGRLWPLIIAHVIADIVAFLA